MNPSPGPSLGISLILLSVLGVLVFLALLFVVIARVQKTVLAKVIARLEERVAKTIPTEQIVRKDTVVVSFGLDSRGVTQSRGNGALVLTPTHLRWLQLVPESSDVSMPLANITAVGTKRSHLGKTYGKPLLHVTFTVDGKADSIAWFSMDVPGWIASLEQARTSVQPAAPALAP